MSMSKCLLVILLFFVCMPISATSFAFDFSSPIGFTSDQSMAKSKQTVVKSKGEAVEATIHPTRLSMTNLLNKPESIMFSADDSYLVAFYERGPHRLWNLYTGEQKQIALSELQRNDLLIPLPNGRKALIFRVSGELRVFDMLLDEGASLGHFSTQSLVVSAPDGRRLVSAAADDSVTLWDLSQIDLLRGIQMVDKALHVRQHRLELPDRATVTALAYSPDGDAVAIGYETGEVLVVATKDGSLRYTLNMNHTIRDLLFCKDSRGHSMLAAGSSAGGVALWTMDDGLQSWSKNVLSGSVTKLGWRESSVMLTASGERGEVSMLELSSGRRARSFEVTEGAVEKAWPLQDGQMLLTFCAEGKVRLFNGIDKAPLLTGVSTRSGWIIIDREGRFDGDEKSFADVKWLVKDVALGLEKFARAYYEPGLLLRTIEQDAVNSRGLFNISEGIPLPPSISKMTFLNDERKAGEPVQLLVAAKDIGARVEDIALYHNGKRLSTSSVIVNKEQTEGGDVSVRAMVYHVTPTEGRNSFRAVGIGLGDIEGQEEKLTETFFGAVRPTALHVLSVGINRYALSGLNLAYATNDAAAISQRLYDYGGIFSGVHRTEIYDQNATKANIKRALRKTAAATNPNDTLIVYLAGHGLVEGSEWYFLPHDIPVVTPDAIRRYGLDSQQISDVLLEARAQKVFLLIDSCYAGQAVSRFDRFELRRIHHLLGRNSGVGVFAAARADQEASESQVLGHGLFTATLLRGLSGEADVNTRDSQVSAKELIDFSKRLIPVYSLDYLKVAQNPVAYFGGHDFPVSSTH